MKLLSLEHERNKGASERDDILADFVNYTAVERLLCREGLGLQEKPIDGSAVDLRPFGNNSRDPFLVAFYRS